MQNFASRILTNTKKFDDIIQVLHELGWLTIEDLLPLRDVTMIFKCLNGLAQLLLSSKENRGCFPFVRTGRPDELDGK